MAALPFEVLVKIFEELSDEDLMECQFVNKLWNQASLKKLYSDVLIDSEITSSLYVRTIKNSPRLGKYLERIDTEDTFQKKGDNPIWDKHGLLDTIIKFCPNLLVLNHDMSSSSFWTKLMYAASQGQLSRLQYISYPYRADYDHYVYTVLSFKNTITSLELPDLENGFPNLRDSEAYFTLRNKLNEFPCLQTLTITYMSEQPLSHYDALIDSCKHLKELTIHPEHCEIDEEITRPGPSIYPHQNIQTLDCKWWLINRDEQLNYIMQKFPNLKSLKVICEGFFSDYFKRGSPEVLIKFLDFATNIKVLDLAMLLGEQECLNIWADIVNEKYKNIELKISFTTSLLGDIEERTVFIDFDKHYKLSLEFAPEEASEILYLNFLSKSGKNIRHLILEEDYEKHEDKTTIFCTIQNIINIIHSCSSLQCLKLWFIDDIPFSDYITYRHPNVKSLTLVQSKHGSSIETLKNMSLILPNLKELKYDTSNIKYGKSEAIIIDMPNTSLDILKWTFATYSFQNVYNFQIYVRCKINSTEKFYIAFEDELSSIGSKTYHRERLTDAIYLDITLQNLTKLQINNFTFTF